jgi:hypothetical protein
MAIHFLSLLFLSTSILVSECLRETQFCKLWRIRGNFALQIDTMMSGTPPQKIQFVESQQDRGKTNYLAKRSAAGV